MRKAADARIKEHIEELADIGDVRVACPGKDCQCQYGPEPDRWSPEKKPAPGKDPAYEYGSSFRIKKGNVERVYKFKFEILGQWKRIEGRCRAVKGTLPSTVPPDDEEKPR